MKKKIKRNITTDCSAHIRIKKSSFQQHMS